MGSPIEQSANHKACENGRPPRVFSWFQALILFAIFFAAGVVCQWGGLEARTVYDGAYFVSAKQAVFESRDVIRVMSMIPARPLFLLTFYGNYLFTGMDPFHLRLVNIGIVAAGGVALAFLVGIIYGIPGLTLPGSSRVKQAVSSLVGLLFVIHPLQSFVNLYVWQREAALACLFVFLGLAVYAATRSGYLARPVVGYVLTAVIFLAGMLSKENVAILPVLMVAGELTLFRQNARELINRTALIAVMLIPSVITYLLITTTLHAPYSELEEGILYRLSVYYAAGGLSVAEVIMTQCRIFFSYLYMMLFPFAGDVEFMRALTVSRSLVNPPETLAAVVGVLVFAAVGIRLVRRDPVIAFGISLLIISLLPESLLIPQYLFFGYRAILPMAGLLLILGRAMLPSAAWVAAGNSTARAMGFAATSVVLVAVCGLGWVTAERAARWTHVSFWTDLAERLPKYNKDVEKTPFLDIAVNCMSVLASEGRYAETTDLFHRVLVVDAGSHRERPDHFDTQAAIEQFLTTFGDTGGRAGGALISLGVALQHAGQTEPAIHAYRKAVELDPHHPDVHITLGVMLEDAGSLDEAMQYYQKAIETDPGSAIAYNCLGNALKKSGNVFEAMQEYSKAIIVDPKSSMGYANLAMALQETGYHREAIAEYRKALAVDENSPDIHHKLGRALAEQGEFAQACVQYRKAISLKPDLAIARADLALALEVTGDVQDALDQFRLAWEADPDSATIPLFFGRALISAGRFSEAAAVLSRAIGLDPDQPAPHYLLGVALECSGHLPAAVSHLKEAVRLEPGFADAHRDLGLASSKTGRFEEAILHLKTAEMLDPSEPRTSVYLGWAMEATGAPDFAAAYFRSAINLKPDFAEAHYGLARCLHTCGKMEEAVRAYRMAVTYGPDTVETYADMAIALLHLGRIPDSIVTLGRALSLNRENAQLLYALGVAYAAMNDNAEAVKYLKKAIDMNPDHVAATERLRTLTKGGGP